MCCALPVRLCHLFEQLFTDQPSPDRHVTILGHRTHARQEFWWRSQKHVWTNQKFITCKDYGGLKNCGWDQSCQGDQRGLRLDIRPDWAASSWEGSQEKVVTYVSSKLEESQYCEDTEFIEVDQAWLDQSWQPCWVFQKLWQNTARWRIELYKIIQKTVYFLCYWWLQFEWRYEKTRLWILCWWQ